MSKIHVNRERQNLGQFSPEDVSEGLRNGRLLPTDLGWREGMETWQPLATFADLPAPGEPAPPTLAPASDIAAPPVAETGLPTPEWERRDEVGYFRAALVTIRQSFADPMRTYRQLTRTGGFLSPLIYCYVLQIICGLVGLLETLVWVRVLPAGVLQHLGEHPDQVYGGNLIVALPTLLIGGFVFPFVFSGIYYAVARLITKKTVNFETVFRAYCYMMGSMSVLNLLPVPPIVPVQVAFMFFVVVLAFGYLVIAMREAVRMTTLEAVAVVVLPVLLCCFCFAAAMGGVAALAGSIPALQNMGQ